MRNAGCGKLRAMRICFISAEISPFAKTGGLGDVAAALTRYLARRGHDLRVFVPLHGQMDLRGVDRHPVEFLQDLAAARRARTSSATTCRRRACRASDLWIYLIDCPALFDRPRIYSDAPDEHVRYLMLTRAALECCQRMGFAPHIVHCERLAHGVRAAAAAHGLRLGQAHLRRDAQRLHDPQHRLPGRVRRGRARRRGPGVGIEALHQADLGAGRINPMRHGILHADAVTTVSPTYAREIRTPEGGLGLDGDLRARGDVGAPAS